MSSSTIPLDDVNLPLANFAPATAGERSATFSTGAARGAYMTRHFTEAVKSDTQLTPDRPLSAPATSAPSALKPSPATSSQNPPGPPDPNPDA